MHNILAIWGIFALGEKRNNAVDRTFVRSVFDLFILHEREDSSHNPDKWTEMSKNGVIFPLHFFLVKIFLLKALDKKVYHKIVI